MTAGLPWWQEAFGADYQDVYGHRSDQDAMTEVSGLLPRLARAPGPILDAGCGNGRHLEALRGAGLVAFGIDFSSALLTHATTRPSCRGRLARCDMRAPALASGWGAILLLFTAFGYFDDQANAALLRTLADLLTPGGELLLDLPANDHLLGNLVPASQRLTKSGLEIMETRRVNGRRIEKTVTLNRPGAPMRRYTESVRLYAPDEILALAAASGLTVADRWPGLRAPDQDERRHVYWLRRGP